ncbi:DUF1479-domain-containing protein [Punctularia strigosozonata HHB-11173 SS5]|uniref:DUF1479-domain-containing protein n=1 Tax=Punctularia strigosozonata (strain HHB-11173) TaxID=741275 RepID=R7S409_PUNST|nr:DUF1479-domain-containing protein [Punctularia strigosozonata HHB-11173 SS5]EIN03971.1 DUF1479-domain-containing protein [Punctularia strigosozonata HHB-11173 SS5]
MSDLHIKSEGDISTVFSSLSSEEPYQWPTRFVALKKEIWKDELIESWRQVLAELEVATEEIEARGNELIPQVTRDEVVAGLKREQVDAIKRVGTVVVQSVVPEEEAVAWKKELLAYISENESLVKGFPPDNIVFYEIYNSVTQTLARTHPSVIDVHKVLLNLWRVSDPLSRISLSTPVSYFDRLRIRKTGYMKLLGPHIDGGSIERWEDPTFRSCFGNILKGGSAWRDHDPWDASPRINARQDLYEAPNQCSIFRPFQGWTSLSNTGPREGTLRVFPNVKLSTAYLILRPFFRPKVVHRSSSNTYGNTLPLGFDDWVVDLDNPDFPGAIPAKTFDVSQEMHPHLRLDKTMIPVPPVKPGDHVYWHCDVTHAVEEEQLGANDSSVLYIPAVPLTRQNALHLRSQRAHFAAGLPAPDFPGGKGESSFVHRSKPEDVEDVEARRMLGLEPFALNTGSIVREGERRVVVEANNILGFA